MHSKHNFLSPHKFLPGTIFSIFTIFGYFQFPPKLCTVTCFTVVVYFSSSPPGLTLATKFLQQKDFFHKCEQSIEPSWASPLFQNRKREGLKKKSKKQASYHDSVELSGLLTYLYLNHQGYALTVLRNIIHWWEQLTIYLF